MVLVAGSRAAWSDGDAAHLTGCADCRASWAIVGAASALGRSHTVDTDRIMAGVRARLNDAPIRVPRRRWIGVGVAAAAAVVIGLGLTSSHWASDRIGVQPEAQTAMFPELDYLSEPQLEVILANVAEPDSVLDGGAAIPRLGDLNDEQLEELILSVEGE